MRKLIVVLGLAALAGGIIWWITRPAKDPCEFDGQVKDEALCVGVTADQLVGADEDYFADMDYGVSKDAQLLVERLQDFVPGITPEEARRAIASGRNNWIVWTAGNDKFWDQIGKDSKGTLDFLKILSNHPSLKFSRDNRWNYLGLVNEPCFRKGSAARADRWGLWLDVRDEDCPKDPFENADKYPGVEIGARGKDIEAGSYYGYATGIVGLRLFPNPAFDKAAQADWDADRFYTDPDYYNNKNLIRPYRVGMSCGFCHVGPNPTNPPADPENPQWANLNSNPGAQYFWIDRIFSWQADPTSFPYQLFHTARPGALDTSLVSSDYINNPRTMNAVYSLVARLENAKRFGEEKLAGGSLDNAQFNDYLPKSSPLNQFFEAPDTVFTPRVLKDGADSVGALGALNRVFVNIGLFSEEWTRHFRPLVGGKTITPFPIKTARKNSSYWQANERQTPNLALFFVATARPDYLRNAPGGEQHLSSDEAVLQEGKIAFAENCARCHSSKLPEKAYSFFPNGCVGPNYLQCWDAYWEWSKGEEFKAEMRDLVQAPDFLDNNFLSTELRVPVTLLETNACSPLASNGIAENIWDNFTSESYKTLPSVGSITVHHPMTGEPSRFEMPGGGRGYTRPASLISAWSTAPFLLNNSLGDFYPSGSVEDRMKSFDSSIRQLLWPQTRAGDRQYTVANGKQVPGLIDRTTMRSFLRIPRGFLPDKLQALMGPLERWLPWLFDDAGIEIGPIPKGTPVNLISNIDLDHPLRTVPTVIDVVKALKKIPQDATEEQAIEIFRERGIADRLLEVSKCPDFVVNRGHYFGTEFAGNSPGLSDQQKESLIEFIKTF
ncbi:hypothetical protein [Pseudomarimonas arenosa]|uniref:Cytochrome c domain-containing protein n=1 Tax=Pseudomarimonas arenosa TaxID=2774145 RepID=A0AAW3ZG38_9GAMM|nr:hypothetical protein [Pseudomarimonas arenosa]MBD8525093.1 hypothetical protein [Pseudomarimonas arenosa]